MVVEVGPPSTYLYHRCRGGDWVGGAFEKRRALLYFTSFEDTHPMPLSRIGRYISIGTYLPTHIQVSELDFF